MTKMPTNLARTAETNMCALNCPPSIPAMLSAWSSVKWPSWSSGPSIGSVCAAVCFGENETLWAVERHGGTTEEKQGHTGTLKARLDATGMHSSMWTESEKGNLRASDCATALYKTHLIKLLVARSMDTGYAINRNSTARTETKLFVNPASHVAYSSSAVEMQVSTPGRFRCPAISRGDAQPCQRARGPLILRNADGASSLKTPLS